MRSVRSMRRAVSPIPRARGPHAGAPLTLEAAGAQFVASRLAGGKRDRTIENYAKAVHRWQVWLEGEGRPGAADVWRLASDDLTDWFTWLRQTPGANTGRPRSPYTLATYGRELIVGLRWLILRGLIPPTLLNGVSAPVVPKGERKRPQTFSDDEVAQLFAACEEGQGEGERLALGMRNRALLAVLLDSGVRRAELASMRVERVDVRNRTLYVADSKTELRTVGIGATYGAKYLSAYLQRARPYLAAITREPDAVSATTGPLWLTRDGDPMGILGVSELFDRLKRRSVIGARCTPHACRRYWITRTIQAGVPLPDIARQAGTSIEVIQAYYYAALESETIARVSQGSPLDKLLRDQRARQARQPGQRGRAARARSFADD